MAGIFSMHSILWTILAIAFQECRAQSNSSLDFDHCWVDAEPIEFIGWARHDEGLGPSRPAAEFLYQTVTATVVTTVDTVLQSTQVTTSLPPDWTPPPTNAAGTQIQVVDLGDTNVTLFVTIAFFPPGTQLMDNRRAFPTAYIRWPKHFTYRSSVLDTAMTTVSITDPPPQPTQPMALDPLVEGIVRYVDPEQISDPKGILAQPMFFYATKAWPPAYSALLAPTYPAFGCIPANGGGPNWGGLDKTWMKIVTSTIYTNAEPTTS